MTSITPAVGIGLFCALLSALGTNLSFLLKQRGAVEAPDVDMRHPVRSAVDLFRSRWWSIGWGVAAVAFALHVAALTLAPISVGQAVLAGGLVFLAVLAERFFGFELGRRQWMGIVLVAVSLTLLTVTGGGGSEGANSEYSLTGMIIFESVAVGLGAAALPDPRDRPHPRPPRRAAGRRRRAGLRHLGRGHQGPVRRARGRHGRACSAPGSS